MHTVSRGNSSAGTLYPEVDRPAAHLARPVTTSWSLLDSGPDRPRLVYRKASDWREIKQGAAGIVESGIVE